MCVCEREIYISIIILMSEISRFSFFFSVVISCFSSSENSLQSIVYSWVIFDPERAQILSTKIFGYFGIAHV